MGRTVTEQGEQLTTLLAKCRKAYSWILVVHFILKDTSLRKLTRQPLDPLEAKEARTAIHRLWQWVTVGKPDQCTNTVSFEASEYYPSVHFPLWRARFKLLRAMRHADKSGAGGPASYATMRKWIENYISRNAALTPRVHLWLFDHLPPGKPLA